MRHGDILSLSLDGFQFDIERRASITVTSIPPDMFRVLWGSSNSNTFLTIEHSSGSILSHQMIELTLPSSSGIRTPLHGVKKNNILNTVAILSVEGLIDHTPIQQGPAVGAFLNTSLMFSPGKAAEENEITVQVTPTMKLEIGDTFKVHLPDFSGRSCSTPVESKPAGSIDLAFWDASTHEITFRLSNYSEPGKPFLFVFPKKTDCAIRIPGHGISVLKEENRFFTINTDALNGPVLKSPPTQIQHIQPIYALRGKSGLSFLPCVSGSKATVKFEFQPAMNLSQGAEVTLVLPGLQAESFSASNLISDPSGIFSRASWDSQGRNELVLTTVEQIARFTVVTVWIPRSAGLTLPVEGIRADDQFFVRISDDQGSMLATAIDLVSPVPVKAYLYNRGGQNAGFARIFLRPLTLTFDTAIGGSTSAITIAGTLRRDSAALKNVEIEVSLPKFRGHEPEALNSWWAVDFESAYTGPPRPDVSGNWSVTKTCTPVCLEGIFAGGNKSTAALHFSNFAPEDALTDANGSNMSVFVNTSNQSLGNASCSVLDGMPGVSCEFKCTTRSLLRLVFPDFASISHGQNMTIRIPSGIIRLPEEGVLPGHSEYIATISGSEGIVTSFATNVQPVGIVTSPPSIDVHPKRLSSEAMLILTFSLAFKLTEFDTIHLELPGFSGNLFRDVQVVTNGSNSPVVRVNSENSSLQSNRSRILIFTLAEGQEINACERMSFTVPSSAGLRLPRAVVRADSPPALMQIKGRYGILHSQPATLPALGSIQTSFVTALQSPSARTIFNFTLVPEMTVSVGEVVSIYLPHFVRHDSECFPVLSEPLGIFALANWSTNTSTLVLRVERGIKPSQSVRIHLPSQTGILLPFQGLQRSDSGLTISANAVSGAVEHMPLHGAPAFGWFLDSAISFSPHQLNVSVQINLTFAASELLLVNDTIILHLDGFTSSDGAMKNRVSVSRSHNHSQLEDSLTRVHFRVSSSGVYQHPMTMNGQRSSNSSIPSPLKCIPCVSSVLFDGDDVAHGYYESVCGKGNHQVKRVHTITQPLQTCCYNQCYFHAFTSLSTQLSRAAHLSK
jgi:hypothetical protein